MKLLTLTLTVAAICLLLAGCVPDLPAPDKQTMQTIQLMSDQAAKDRAEFKIEADASLAKIKSDSVNLIASAATKPSAAAQVNVIADIHVGQFIGTIGLWAFPLALAAFVAGFFFPPPSPYAPFIALAWKIGFPVTIGFKGASLVILAVAPFEIYIGWALLAVSVGLTVWFVIAHFKEIQAKMEKNLHISADTNITQAKAFIQDIAIPAEPSPVAVAVAKAALPTSP